MGYGAVGIGPNTVGLPYRSFLDWVGKSSNFSDFMHCSSRFFCTVHLAGPAIFFLLIQRVFKYSNDSNLQNKKPVLTEL
jgi:hypothetical protein